MKFAPLVGIALTLTLNRKHVHNTNNSGDQYVMFLRMLKSSPISASTDWQKLQYWYGRYDIIVMHSSASGQDKHHVNFCAEPVIWLGK